MDKPAVLFLCTGNSARSQMAEALLRRRAGDRFEARSAGLEPKGVHPLTIRALNEIGVETSDLVSEPVSKYLGKKSFRYAIIVCSSADENCPRIYPFVGERLSWPIEDPAAVEGSEEQRIEAFREVRDAIDDRLAAWLDSITAEPL